MFLLLAVAFASPGRLAASLDVGTGATDLVVDGETAALTVDGSVVLVDLATWDATTISACTDAAGLAAAGGVFYVGCGDGTVTTVTAAGDRTEAAYTLGGAVHGLVTDGTTLHAVTEVDGTFTMEAVTVADGGTVSGFPTSFLYADYEDLAVFGTAVLVLHGNDDVTRVELSSGYTSLAAEAYGGSFGQAWPDGSFGVLLADRSGGGVARFDGADNGFSPILSLVGDEVSAVATEEEVLYVAVDGTLLSYGWTTGGYAGALEAQLEDVGTLTDLLPLDGYLLATDGGRVLVMTDRPWVEVTTLSSTAVGTGETVEVGFTADADGSWELVLDADGTVLDSGDLTAGATATASFVVDDRFPEGTNRLRVEVDGSGGVGHDAVDLSVDNPPGAVTLDEGSVGVGDGQIYVKFDGLDDADIGTYTVYLSASPFTAAEWPTGGPDFEEELGVDAPYTDDATPGASFGVSFYPLVNGTTYYVAVRATDAGGLEGPMSEVVSATPLATYSASQLSGDPGGIACSGAGPGPVGLGALLLSGVALLRRRSAVAAAVVVAGLAAAAPARAEDVVEEDPRPHMHVQLKGGPITLADPHIRDIFGKVNKSFGVEYGATTRLVELGLGIGMYQELGFLPMETGEASVEHDMLTLVPLTATGTLRLDFFDEQILVPMGRIGVDYVMWKENWYVYEGSPEESLRKGAKFGWHWGAGLMILLDPLDPKASSRMRATAGIDDTFLVVEYRRTQMPKGENVLLLSAEEVTFGVKFDF